MNYDIEDLRDDARKFASQQVEVDFPCDGGKLSHFFCSSKDISSSGVKLISLNVMKLGNTHCIKIDLGEGYGIIKAVGEVKWCLEIDDVPTYYVGVKLQELSATDSENWNKFIDQI
ncbi:MAG: hypothetical protein ACJAS9_000650 [Polaribacter sp.]|jgi:hypothetical protein